MKPFPRVNANPYPWPFDGAGTPANTALVIIDMQFDFVGIGGYVDRMGYDLSAVRAPIAPISALLARARALGMHVIHTREGHSPDLADCPPTKIVRGRGSRRIGDEGPMGRILVRGERGHDIVPELYPQAGEVVVDKPRKGAFCATDLDLILHNRGIRSLLVCGVTPEVCVNTTVREANDRGYECVVLSDCVGSYFPEFQRVALEMIKAQGGIFGWVSNSEKACRALGRTAPRSTASAVG